MELIKKTPSRRFRDLLAKITDDNLFLLSSSVSYYSALGLAPFLLILLGVASILGQNIQERIVTQMSFTFSPEVGEMVRLVFENVNEGVNLGSLSGVIGAIVLLWTASLVFIQFRYAFDVIYGYVSREVYKTNWEFVKERLFAMLMILGGAVLIFASFSIAAIVDYFFGIGTKDTGVARFFLFWVYLFVYVIIFTCAHYFIPTIRPRFKDAIKIAVISSFFFLIGNIVLAIYFKKIATHSVYGAAGSLLVFLSWTYYSSFTVFLSTEVFLYLKRIGRIR